VTPGAFFIGAPLDTGSESRQYGVMRHVSPGTSIAAAGAILAVLIAFVAYRARTFHYCAGYGSRNPHVNIVASDQSCGAGEESTAFRNVWQAEGLPAKAKMMRQTVVHAFVP